MSFVLAAKPRFVYLTNKQLQTIGKRLLTQSAKSSFKSSQCLLSGPNTMIKTASPKKNQQQYRKSVALVSGVIIVGSYIVFNQSNYFNLDTLPLNLPPPQQSKNCYKTIKRNTSVPQHRHCIKRQYKPSTTQGGDLFVE